MKSEKEKLKASITSTLAKDKPKQAEVQELEKESSFEPSGDSRIETDPTKR